MGCSNARLLVQAPLTGEPNAGTTNALRSSQSTVTTSPTNIPTDTNNTTTRMHLTGVDLVVERNGSYTLLLTPKTHKQLMPYVLRKKRFRILVDKPRSDQTLTSNEPIMENNKELKTKSKKDKKMESTIESIEQIATKEYEKAKGKILGGRSIDRGNPEDEDEYIQSDDEDMMEEIVTTVEQDKDLECKIKKKVETKKTIAQHPETHNTITKVVKTEVTEITRTITISDHHDLERAKRELGIDDVNRLLPSAKWIDQTRYEPIEIVTSKDSSIKQIHPEQKTILAESTTVGRGPVTETITSEKKSSIEIKKKKKKSKLCSCTRAPDDEQEKEKEKEKVITPPIEQSKKPSVVSTPIIKSSFNAQLQGQPLISSDIKQLIIDKKFLLIEYIHSKIFAPLKLFTTPEQDTKARKISSRILDLLRYDRCSSWNHISEQLQEEYAGYSPANLFLQPMINTYENLFTTKQANLLNTFSTIHNENDIKHIHENNDYLNIAQTHINQSNIEIIPPKQSIEKTEDTLEHIQQTTQEEKHEQVIDNEAEQKMTKDIQIEEPSPIYNEEYLIKMLADISQHKPITLAEAIAYQYIDLEDPKLGLSNDTIQRIKNLFHPLSDESLSNLIRVKRSGKYLTDVNLSEINPFEKLNQTEPLIYQLQQTFEPTLDFNEKQFRSLTEIILNNKDQYDKLEFDVARTSLPLYDIKESSTTDFSQSDSGYSMTTATHESLASKIKIEFEPINQDIPIPPKRDDLYEIEKIDLDKATQEQLDKHELNHDLIQIIKMDFNGSDKTIGQAILSRELRLDSTDPSDISYFNSLGIHKEQIRILTKFFFPKNTRIIAYSPEPGRFVEAQTTYNPDYPGYKTDTTIIQIQEKQLSSDHHAMQRNIHDERPSQPEQITPIVAVQPPSPPPKDKTPPRSIPVYVKKRKSSTSGGLLSCFKSKKPKPGTEQQGQPTVLATETNVLQEQITKSIEEKPVIDYSILPDGKRIYIDAFRDRPGLDMSYRPNNFENRYILPIAKSPSEYERPITPEPPAPILLNSEIIGEEKVIIQSEESKPSPPPPIIIEHKPHIHLEPRPAVIEPVDVQPEQTPIIIPSIKSEDKTVTKKAVAIDLHGASVNLPKIESELVQPGPLPTLQIKKVKIKKSTGGICASCLGKKSVEKKKKEIISEPIPVPIEQRKSIEKEIISKSIPPPIEQRKSIEKEIISEPIPVSIEQRKSIEKKEEKIELHGASVNLPKLELVEPGPLPTLPIKEVKVKKPTGGLCASCVGKKSAEKKKKEIISEPIPVPIEQRKSIEKEEKTIDLHGASVNLPKVELVEPGPLPTLPIKEIKVKKSVEKKKKEIISEPISVPIEQRKSIEKEEEKIDLHGASVNLPKLELVEPGPLPILPIKEVKVKKPTGGLCASCFGKKSAEKKKKEIISEPLPAPIEQRKSIEKEEEKKEALTPTIEVPSLPSTVTDEPILPRINIDVFRERNFETLSKSEDRSEKPIPIVEPYYQSPSSEPVPQTINDTSIFSKVNIDQFKERTFQKSSEHLPKLQETPSPPPEEPHYQLPTYESLTVTKPIEPIIAKDTSIFSQVNIDQFKERTLQKSSENIPKSQETPSPPPPPPEEPHYQLPTNEPILTTKPIEPIITKDTSIFSQVNIDQFKERTFEKSSENLPKPQETPSPPPPEEPHYQLPTYESVTVTKPIERTITKDSSIFSQVNIDIFRERKFEIPPKKEEPHYAFPSSEPVPPTYDIPRTIELEQTIETKTEEKIMTPPTTDVQKSSGDFITPKTEEISPIKNEIMPNVEVKKTKKKKGSLTLPIKKKKSKEPKESSKKSKFFSTLFRRSKRKSKIPALDLPSVERELSPNNQLRSPHRHDSDPLRIPSTDLPKLNVPLPTYDRPEVDMTTGSIKQSSEFTIPAVNFPPIPNLNLPENIKQSIDLDSDLMKVPNVQLPNLEFTLNNQENVKLPEIQLKTKTEQIPLVQPVIITGLALSSPVNDLLCIQTDHKNFPIETDYAIKKETIITTQITEISKRISEQQITIINTHLVQSSEVTTPNIGFQLPSPEPVLTLPKAPSFDDDVPSPPSKIVPAHKPLEKQSIETKSDIKKKSSTLALCSCFGTKSTISKDKTHQIEAPKSNLPEIDMPIPSSNISSTLKTKEPLRAPSNDLPSVDLTLTSTEPIHLPTIHIEEKKQTEEKPLRAPSNDLPPLNLTPTPIEPIHLPTIHIHEKKQTEAIVPSIEIKKEKEEIKSQVPSTPPPTPIIEEQTKVKTDINGKQPIEEIQTKQSSLFEIKAPVMNIPEVDLSGPPKSEAYISFSKHEESTSIPEQIQSRSDSGLEAIISSHVHPSSTFGTHTTIGDIQQYSSISSGFGSGILDDTTIKSYSIREYDETRSINLNDETRTKFISQENQLKKSLETEISKSIDDFNTKKDQKSLNKILTHGINLIKDKKITTYSELKQKLIIEHKNHAFIVEPVVRSLYYTIENHGLDNLDKPEFPLAIHDMVRLPAKQTYDTVTHLNKESASLTTTPMPKETLPISETARSCLTCGRSKSKTKLPVTTTTLTSGLLDERRRIQLNTHRNELGNILRDHIQSSKTPIRQFAEHSKEVDKILRKSLTLVTQPNILSYEQIRNDLKTEYKQTYYLIDPIVDITRDTFDHCDITQMNEKINLDILDSNISQTANLYNNNQSNLLTLEEYNSLKSNQLSWLQSYLIDNESKEKKLTRKQTKELNKILHRTLEILSQNLISTWDELILQLQREYPKAHDLCNRSIELIKQSQKDGLFHLQQAPAQDKRRASSLITERARQNLKTNRNKIILSLKNFLTDYNKSSTSDEKQLEIYLKKTFHYLEEQKPGQFKTYNDLKEQLKKDFHKHNQDKLIEQIVDIIEQAHANNQFDDLDKPEVQNLMKDRLDGKPLIIKEMYVSLPPRVGASSANGERTTISRQVGRGLSWREANERARILFYRGKHPAIHYDEQAAAFDVRMLLETASGGTQEIPVTDSDIHELLNSCGVQWDGVNIISLVDHSEDVVRAAEQAALKVIREKGLVELRTPPSPEKHDETINSSS